MGNLKRENISLHAKLEEMALAQSKTQNNAEDESVAKVSLITPLGGQMKRKQWRETFLAYHIFL